MVNPDNPQHPTPGVEMIDRICIAADQQERQQAQQATQADSSGGMWEVATKAIEFFGKQNVLLLEQVASLRDQVAELRTA